MIQDLSGSWLIKGTGESSLVMDSPVTLMHHDPDRSWITDPDPDHPKGTHPMTEGRKAGRASKPKPGPHLSSKSGSTTAYILVCDSYVIVTIVTYKTCH